MMSTKRLAIVLFAFILMWGFSPIVSADVELTADEKIKAAETQILELNEKFQNHKQQPHKDDSTWFAVIAIIISSLSLLVSTWAIISKKQDRDRDEAVSVFHLFYSDPVLIPLRDLDLTSAKLVSICNEKDSALRVNQVTKLWKGEISDLLIKLASGLHALDRSDDVNGSDWGENTDDARDMLDKSLNKLCDEKLSEIEVIENCNLAKNAISNFCGGLEKKFKAEISRRHKGK